MNILTTIGRRLHAATTGTVAYLRTHWRGTLGVLIVLFLAAGALHLFSGRTAAPEATPGANRTSVSLATVAALGSGGSPLTTLGEVRSESEADLRAQKSAQVTHVYVHAGQYVAPGTILGELENQSERASVLQAQGALAAAQAALAKVEAGARAEDRATAGVQAAGAIVTLQAAQDAARTAYSSAYSAAQDAIFVKADTLFDDPYTVAPTVRIRSATYDERAELQRERVVIGGMLDTWKAHATVPLSADGLESALRDAQRGLEAIKSFLDRLSTFVSKQEINSDFTATDKATQDGNILAARTEIDGARSGVAGALQGLANATTGQQSASLAESKIAAGATPEDTQAAEAGVTQARGAVAAAQAGLEKSLVRTPIGGTVTTLAMNQGDYVTPGTVLAVVAAPNALEVQANVSESMKGLIGVGTPARVADTYDGIVTSIDPGLDPTTKTARVHVGLSGPAPTLANGQYVHVSFTATRPAEEARATASGFALPIEAIKVLPQGLAVFTVSASSTLEAHAITEGTIIGGRMLVKTGLTPDMLIVTDVRGLSEGEVVEVSTSTSATSTSEQ